MIAEAAQVMNIDVLVLVQDGEYQAIGVRLRPFRKDWPPKIMVLGQGGTFDEAFEQAYERALAGRYEVLDWAARPWHIAQPTHTSALKAPGTR